MNLLKALVITATLIITCTHLSAQKKGDTATTEKNWYIKDALHLSDTQSLAIFEHTESENGVCLINNKGAVAWELPFEGCVMAISKYKDNFLVFYSKKGYWSKLYPFHDKIKQINAAILDLKSHKIIEDKVVYTGSKFIVPDFHNDLTGNFSQLLVRQSSSHEKEETEGVTVISFNTDGSVANKEITSIAPQGLFIGSSAGKDGSIFISSIQNGSSVVVEKFSHEGVLISKQESPVNFRKKSDYKAVMRTDTYTNNAVLLNLMVFNQEKDKAFSFFRFDFDNNQVAVSNEPPLNKSSGYKYIRDFKDFEPNEVHATKDKIVMIKMVKFLKSYVSGNTTSTQFNNGTVIVSVFDRQMNLQRNVVLQKACMSYNSDDIKITTHINNDRIYILTGETTSGWGGIGNFCYNVNLNDGKFEKKKIGYTDPSSTSMFAPATVWFGNEFLLAHWHYKQGKYKSILERIGFDAL
jgi:hypothetical protein